MAEKNQRGQGEITVPAVETEVSRALVEDVATDPGMHGDRGSGTGVDRAGRAELLDVQDHAAYLLHRRGEPRALLPEDEHARARQVVGLQRD